MGVVVTDRISLCDAYEALRQKMDRPCGFCGLPVGFWAYLDREDRAYCSEECFRAELSGIERPPRLVAGKVES